MLEHQVREAFGPEGPLVRADAQFRPRPGQTDMAVRVAQTVEHGGVLVVEAGTGVGKTFAYLVPAILSGERVIVSTATKTLQDQLFGRDLPRLAQVLGLPVRTALLKGRASYLCPHRLEQARQHPGMSGAAAQRVLAKVEAWSRQTRTGDLAELRGLDERSEVIPIITSTRENCLGGQCPRIKDCHLQTARREAMAADLVVVNHHLFFADVLLRESGMAELLPSARVVVFDEAHQLNDTGVQFLGQQLSTHQLADFARDLLAAGLAHARGMADWLGWSLQIEKAAQDLRGLMVAPPTSPGASTRWRWVGEAPQDCPPSLWQPALRRLVLVCAQPMEALEQLGETAPDLLRLHERAARLLALLARFETPAAAGVVRWVEVDSGVRLMETPLDIGQAMRTRLLDELALEADADGWPATEPAVPRAWVFTSATLGHEPSLGWFTDRCGLQGAAVMQVESPFDYPHQAALYVPDHFPTPSDPAHADAVARLAAQAALRLGGRTLVLTTTLKALRTIGDRLQELMTVAQEPIDILVQGQGSKVAMMERFRAGSQAGRGGCILVASASFWEGFDVPGDALQVVIIDKLPFPPPGDPVVDAHCERIAQAGGSPFTAYALPEAAIALKQGAGRLIRSEDDRGILVVADVRLAAKGYGKRLLRALPPMRRLHTAEDWLLALQHLADFNSSQGQGPTIPSTTDLCGRQHLP